MLFGRRSFIAGLSAALARAQQTEGKGQAFPTDARRYLDAATDFQMFRLTSPNYTSVLTSPHNRSMPGRNVLYFSNDRTGRMEVYRLDTRSGQSRLLTAAAALDPSSVAVASGERYLYFFDGPVLSQSTLSSLKERDVYRVPDGVTRGSGFSVTADGQRGFFIEREAGQHRLRMINLARGLATTVVEANEELSDPIPRPGRPDVLYRRGASWHLAGADSRASAGLALAPGEARSLTWTPDGSAILYLNISSDRGQLNSIRELNLETTTNKLVSKTSQFAAFAPNGDASVFVGASASKASPHVLLLIRSVRRELTVCEHRASDPRIVAPLFAPGSQRILFVSDQHGKPAVYTMDVERFVEETES